MRQCRDGLPFFATGGYDIAAGRRRAGLVVHSARLQAGSVDIEPLGVILATVSAMSEIDAITSAILEGAPGEEIGALPLPKTVRGALVKAEEQEMFDGIASDDKDPRKSIHVEEFPLPELAPDEAYVGVMASAINFNTVWTSIFEPLPTFGFLKRLGKRVVLGQAPRSAVPRHRVRRRGCGVARRERGA